MEKETNTKSKGKKIAKIVIPIVIVLSIVAGVLISKLTDKGIKVKVAEVKTGDVEQYYDTTGTLEAGKQDKFYIYDGVAVTTVNVNIGSEVKAGDVLATFDTSSMNKIISEKKSAYNSAQATYLDAVNSQNDAAANSERIDKEIADLEAQKAATTPDPSIPNATAQIDGRIQLLQSQKQMYQNGQGDSMIKAYKAARDSAKDEYDKAVTEKKEMDKGWVATTDGKVSKLSITAGETYKFSSESDGSSNELMSALAGALSNGESLSAEAIVQGLSITGNNGGAQKGLGLVVDSYGGYKVTFSLGKYDVQTVKTDMPAVVTYTDYKYDGTVSFINAVASTSQAGLSSLMGGSSQQSSGGGVKAEVTIKNPDSNLVLGFDAKLSILTNKVKGAVVIPVEALVIEDGKKFVYIYDGKTGTAELKEIDIGISSDKFYEVKSGLKVGQKVIINASKVTDGAKVYVGESK